MFIGDQGMFLRDTLDPASKIHRLRADEHIPGNGRIGCDRRWQKNAADSPGIRGGLLIDQTRSEYPA